MKPLPRKGSIVYNIKFGTEEERKSTLRKWKFMNRFVVVPLARLRLLPLLGLKNTFIVISVLGRKSKKRRYAGISLRKLDEGLFVFLARGMKTQWLKNHQANPEETYVYYGFRRYQADLQILEENMQVDVMSKYVVRHPKWAKLGIGWDAEKDDPHGELLKEYVSTIEVAEIII